MVLEISLAHVVRPVSRNKFHVGLGSAAGDAVAWLLNELFKLVIVSLAPNFGSHFWSHDIFRISRSAWWLYHALCYQCHQQKTLYQWHDSIKWLKYLAIEIL